MPSVMSFKASLMTATLLFGAQAAFAADSSVEMDPLDAQILKETERINTERALSKFKNLFNFGTKEFSDGHGSECRLAVVPPDKATTGIVHLTFDDGPRRSTTPRVLDILKARNIKATFFILGSRIKGNEDILHRMVREGHEVGIHSWDHPNFNRSSAAEGIRQIEKTKEKLDYLGIEAKFFRYPYGAANCGTNSYLEDQGYKITGWHVDTCDWAFVDGKLSMKENMTCGARGDEKDDFSLYVANQTKRDRGGIILLHDIHENSVRYLESIISRLEKDNYRFVSLTEKAYFPVLNDFN